MQALTLLTGLHPQVVSLAPYRLQDRWEDVKRIGYVLGYPDLAKTIVQYSQQCCDDLRHQTAVLGHEPHVAVLAWLDPLTRGAFFSPYQKAISWAGGTRK